MKKPTLLVLAAGMGSRYGGLKQMDAMGPRGETILDFSLRDAIRAGFGRVIFVIRRDFSNEFQEKFGRNFEGEIELEYVFQEQEDLPKGFALPKGRVRPWGTAHAILAGRHLIKNSFVVINADDFYGSAAFQQAAAFLDGAHCDDLSMVGYPIEKTLSENGAVNRGVCEIDREGFLVSVEEITEIKQNEGRLSGFDENGSERILKRDEIVSMNFWVFPPGFMDDLAEIFEEFLKAQGDDLRAECYIPTVVDSLIRSKKRKCQVLQTDATWFGVTYPQDKARVAEALGALIENGEYE